MNSLLNQITKRLDEIESDYLEDRDKARDIIESLTASLRVACAALEYYQGKLYHADKAIEQIAEKLKVDV